MDYSSHGFMLLNIVVNLLVAFRYSECSSQPCSGFVDSNGVCYELSASTRTWQDAVTACNNTGAILAVIENDYDQSTLRTFLQNNGVTQPVWLGGHRQTNFRQAFVWRWTSDKSIIRSQGCYKDNPNARDLPHQMTYLSDMTIDKCVGACRTEGYAYAGLQSGAFCYCGNEYGLYGAVDTAIETNNCDTPCEGNTSTMCGSSDRNSIFSVNGSFSLWGFVRPNNWEGYQTCGIMRWDISFKMDDDNCGMPKLGFMCDIPTSKCSNGAVMLNGACYFIGSVPPIAVTTWFDARMQCIARGGDLVRITSSVVWNTLVGAVTGLPNQNYWIGVSGFHWYWSNGLEMTYYAWYAQGTALEDYRPNTINKACVVSDPSLDYQWADEDCTANHVFVCMSGKNFTTTAAPSTAAMTTTTITTTTTTTTRTAAATTPTENTGTTLPLTTPINLSPSSSLSSTTTKSTTSLILASSSSSSSTTSTSTSTSSPTTTTTTTTTNNDLATASWPFDYYDYTDIPPPKADQTPLTNKSTSSSSQSWSPLLIALLVICCILAIILIILVIVFACYRKNNRVNQIKSSYVESEETPSEEADFSKDEYVYNSTETLHRPGEEDVIPQINDNHKAVISLPPWLTSIKDI